LGFRGDDLVSFRLKLNNPSKIAELQELEHWKSKFDIAGGATENFFSRRWIAQNIFSLSEEEFVRNQREMFHDRKYEAELNAAGESAAEAAAGGFGDLGADDLGDLGDLDDLGTGEDLGDLGAGPDLGGEGEEGPLLAAPAKRNDDRDDRNRRYTKNSLGKKAKGKRYVPTPIDGRNGREQNYTAMAFPRAKEIVPGMENLMGLSRGIYETKQPNYNKEEALLFEASSRVKDLVAELENLEIQIDENETQ
jgi:hypothetical protein